MERTKGLQEYIRLEKYRSALGLPEMPEEEYRMLAQGEYNRNYVFRHPVTGKQLVLRINFGSQMHLEDQIQYEGRALKLLENSGRTPKVLYVDGTKQEIPYGIMVMEYLPGRALDYRTDLRRAAACLADIHSVKIPENNGLIRPRNPLRAIMEECEEMVKTYMDAGDAPEPKKRRIRALMEQGWRWAENAAESPVRCCINTELNSTNFLISEGTGADFLIDWEKPLYGDPAQDLGHFLAPTTTFWKTDVILEQAEIEEFMRAYFRSVDKRFDTDGLEQRTRIYLPVTCLRGITWCAMAWVEYRQPDKAIFNETTFRKLEQYLSDEFLDRIEAYVAF